MTYTASDREQLIQALKTFPDQEVDMVYSEFNSGEPRGFYIFQAMYCGKRSIKLSVRGSIENINPSLQILIDWLQNDAIALESFTVIPSQPPRIPFW